MTWQDFLSTQNARFSEGVVADFGDAAQELVDAQMATIVTPLFALASLEIRGEEAAAFLHKQVTSHVEHLAANAWQRSAWCSHKGRVIADFLLVHSKEGFRAYMASDLQDVVLKKLSMYVLRSKVKITKPEANRALLGLAGKNAEALLKAVGFAVPDHMQICEKDDALVLNLSPTRFLLDVPEEAAISYWQAFVKSASPAGQNAWDLYDLQAGIAHITQATSEAFVPQMLHFDHFAHVHFQKGCYPGQEVIMRARHLGKIKRHLYLLECDAPPKSGSIISSGDRENIGQIVSAVTLSATRALAQAVLSEEFAEADLTVHAEIPVRLLQKPSLFPTSS